MGTIKEAKRKISIALLTVAVTGCSVLVPGIHYRKKFNKEVAEGIEQPFQSPADLDGYITDKVREYLAIGLLNEPDFGPRKWAANFAQSDKYKEALAAATERHAVHLKEQAWIEDLQIKMEAVKQYTLREQERIAKEEAAAAERARVAATKARRAREEEQCREALLSRISKSNPRLKSAIDRDGGSRVRLSDLKSEDDVLYYLDANVWVDPGAYYKYRATISPDYVISLAFSETATKVVDRVDGYEVWRDGRLKFDVTREEFGDTGEAFIALRTEEIFWPQNFASRYGAGFLLWEENQELQISLIYDGQRKRINAPWALSSSYKRVFKGQK